MAGFTIEGVAALAGASKMTIYKWWPTKGVLALEGYAASVDDVVDVPDTGDVEADLTTALTSYAHALRVTAGRVTVELLGAGRPTPSSPPPSAGFTSSPGGPWGREAAQRTEQG